MRSRGNRCCIRRPSGRYKSQGGARGAPNCGEVDSGKNFLLATKLIKTNRLLTVEK